MFGGEYRTDESEMNTQSERVHDVDIIHDGCRKVTDYIMKVCEMFELHKPCTNYKRARQAYLQLVKKAKKKGRMVRETIAVACKEQDVLRVSVPV